MPPSILAATPYACRPPKRARAWPGCLFQQYICDVWISTDQSRLRWVEQHQAQLRASLYSGLEDAVGHGETDVELGNLGHRVVLLSSYIGGPQYMNQHFQDAIAVACHYKGFNLFITFMSPPSTRAIRRLLQRDKYALCQFVSPQEAHEGRSCDCLTR